ncbi:TIGR04255 family protein [Methylomonas koyamae]|uniref:TIGR04255 family protein n=1 Tax=Methylomonas koyamae TaxID=702114 RepID=UPI002873DF1C|nr:TIGR04255 family protein [Methylomonas koyamae]WNB76634.1 TIGR04255 family protein [Methylomonas koyamae]
MAKKAYDSPPITEAVIEIRFYPSINEKVLTKTVKAFAKYYPELIPIDQYEFEVIVDKGVPTTNTKTVREFKRTSQDMTEVIVLKNSAFVLSQLAPYKSWENFIARFERDWNLQNKIAGQREILRIGVRFINRIDIPRAENDLVNEYEYLNIYPKQPAEIGPFLGYAVQSQMFLPEINSFLRLNSAVVPSPLIDNISIVFDQDISRESELPQNTKDILVYLNEVRGEKNKVFELCVTDKARELFRK